MRVKALHRIAQMPTSLQQRSRAVDMSPLPTAHRVLVIIEQLVYNLWRDRAKILGAALDRRARATKKK